MSELIVISPKPENIAQKIQRLQTEARALADGHVREMITNMYAMAENAEVIAVGGDAYLPGVRDEARKLQLELESRARTIAAILQKAQRRP